MMVFLGVMSNIASDSGYVILIPLGAMMFKACGRHPLAGLAAAFAGVSGGFSANLLIGTLDPLLAGITQSAVTIIDPTYEVAVMGNYIFLCVSTFLITILGTIITDKIVEPRLGKYEGEIDTTAAQALTDAEKKGMRYAGIAALVYIALILVCLIPTNGLLRSATGGVLSSPFMSGIIFFMMLLFLIPGIAFGIGAGTIKSDKDVVDMMTKGIQGLGGFMVLIFFAAQFTSLFTMSNLGTILSFKGADFLRAIGFTGLPLIIAMIILTALVNLLVAVDSAKWVMMAPIFVPMFMNLGFAPELTQVAYRIGDSCTNIIAPTMPFFVLTVSLFQKYDKKAGIGSVVATMLPYTIGFLIGWTILFSIFYMLNLPLGPGATIFYAG
jgi:aminobenzoyl-glutamate transport protein